MMKLPPPPAPRVVNELQRLLVLVEIIVAAAAGAGTGLMLLFILQRGAA